MDKSNKHPTCRCDCCDTEIPLSAALSAEGINYVRHFCGEDCYKKWEKMQKKDENKK